MTRPSLLAIGPASAKLLAGLHAGAFPSPARWREPAFAALLGLPNHGGLLDPAGGFVLGRVVADEAEILTLAVLPTARRRGLGRALVSGWQHQAQRRGATRLFLEVAVENFEAQALYAACGFATVGRRRGYYPDGTDALVLACRLVPGG